MTAAQRTRFIAALAAGVISMAPNADAYVREASNWNPGSLPIQYGINLSTAPSEIGASGAQSAVEAGFASWSAPACSAWRTTDTGPTTRRASNNDRQNTILWVSGTWPATLGDVNSVIGVTTPVWTSGGYFIDADIQFNNVGFTWSLTGARNTVDTQSIATHEEGHFLGLDHSATNAAVMYASYSGGTKRVLDCDDIRGACAIYPSGGDLPSTCGGGTMMPPTGTGATGSPCTAPTECTSGLCVSDGTNQFCSARCTDDCGCPVGYHCFATTTAGVSVCAAGGNTCSTGRDSGTTMMPTGHDFGEPCSASTECRSNLCAHASGATTGFCTRACADDATCPCGYQCFPTTTPDTNVCGPGTDTCTSTDAGTVTPVGDAGVDAGPMGVDAAMAGDAGGGDSSTENHGCGCAIPGGHRDGTTGRIAMVFAVALGVVIARRRRQR